MTWNSAPRLFSLLVLMTFVCGTAPSAGETALSLVHEQSRIDIPSNAITSIEAGAIISFIVTETGQKRDYPLPHINVCYSAEIQAQVCRLTRQIVDQPLSIVVDCEPISNPVVREPVCGRCMQLSANDIQEANVLAQRMKKGSDRRCRPMS